MFSVCLGQDVFVETDAFPMHPMVQQTDSAGNYSLKILGQSGKFTLYNTAAGQADENKVTIEMDGLYEVDEDGTTVGFSGQTKHSINTFAPQEFSFEPTRTVVVGSATGSLVVFKSNINGLGDLQVETLMITEGGWVGSDELKVGALKFNIGFPAGWTWCDPACKTGEKLGQFIDLWIAVKGRGGDPLQSGSDSYDLGGGAKVELNSAVEIDDLDSSMPAGYPKLEVKGSKQVFIFRFPRFNSKAKYDPIVTFSSPGGPDDRATGLGAKSLLLSLLAGAFFLI